MYTVLNTYNVALYERFKAAGYDLTDCQEMGSIVHEVLGLFDGYRVQHVYHA